MTEVEVVIPGRCRVCGCTETTPCHLEHGEPCAWFDREKTLCTNLMCIGKVPMCDLEQLHLAEDPAA